MAAAAVFHDKVGGSEALIVAPGQSVRDILRSYGIPTNAVITRINGRVVPEDTAKIGSDDRAEFWQVRHYDLNVTRKPRRQVLTVNEPVYVKSVLFDKGGEVEVRSEQLERPAFIEYVERTFVEGIGSKGLIRPGAHIITGLSGGRDSVAFLQLLNRTKDSLPPFTMTAVTVTGLPDWEEPATFDAARAACASLGIDHVIVEPESITEVFKLPRPFATVMKEVAASETEASIMVIGHQVLRRMIEIEAERRRVSEIALCFNSDDLVASLVTWFTSGFRMGSLPARSIGRHHYLFPLFRITKKELTLYLEFVAPELNRQGAPGRFTTGPGERSMSYAIADHLFDLWPGIDYYLFEAFSNVQRYLQPKHEETCSTCGAIVLEQVGFERTSDACDVCSLFSRQELSAVR